MSGNEFEPHTGRAEDDIDSSFPADPAEAAPVIEGTVVDESVPDEIVVRHSSGLLSAKNRIGISLGAGALSFAALTGLGIIGSCEPQTGDPKHSHVTVRTIAVKPVALDCRSVVVDQIDATLATQASILGHNISSIGYTANVTGKVLELVCAKTALAQNAKDPSRTTESARTPAIKIVDGPVKDEGNGNKVQTKQVRVDISSLVAIGIMDPTSRVEIEPKFTTRIAAAEDGAVSVAFEAACNTATLLQARDQCGSMAHTFDSWDSGSRADLDAAARQKVLEESKDCLTPAWPSIAVAIRRSYEAQGQKPGDIVVVFVEGPDNRETTKTPSFSKEPFSELYKDGVLQRDKGNKPSLKLNTENKKDICKVDNDALIANGGTLPTPSASRGSN